MPQAGGYYDLSDEDFLKDLIQATFSSPDRIGVIEEYHLRFYRADSSVSRILVYTDISNELAILSSLIRNCILIGLACFLVFLCISFLLADWVAKPVDRAWEQQRQFIADASHELKTPLTVIMTDAELMQNPDYDETSRPLNLSSLKRGSRCAQTSQRASWSTATLPNYGRFWISCWTMCKNIPGKMGLHVCLWKGRAEDIAC